MIKKKNAYMNCIIDTTGETISKLAKEIDGKEE